jgi:ABC-type microcin C transport system duplicated ATPase subunit YejF
MAILEVQNIEKSFGNIEVLKDISFTMKKGEVVSIIGSSGSGKTNERLSAKPYKGLFYDAYPSCKAAAKDWNKRKGKRGKR